MGAVSLLALATLGSQRMRRLCWVFFLHPVPVTAPCKPQVPREARRLRRTMLRRLSTSTSNQRLQRLKVCKTSSSASRVTSAGGERETRPYRAGRSDTNWTARAAKGPRTSGGIRACPRTATLARRRRPQSPRCKSGTSRGQSTLAADPHPWTQ